MWIFFSKRCGFFFSLSILPLPLLGSVAAGHRTIRALSAHSAAEFNSSPGRWQQVWLVAIVPPERWGKMDRNDCHTAWGNFKTLISSLHHYKIILGFFHYFFFNFECFFLLCDLVSPSTGCKSQLF